MSLLSAYRHQLAEEAAGRSRRFGNIMRALRLLWIMISLGGAAFAIWLVYDDLNHPYPGGGWSLLISPAILLMAVVIGAVPYGIGQLFLSVKAKSDG